MLVDRRTLLTRGPSVPRTWSAAADVWLRVHRVAMACRFEILLSGEDQRHAAAAHEALAEADRLEAAWSIYRDDSAVARLNRSRGGGTGRRRRRPVRVACARPGALATQRRRLRRHHHAAVALLGLRRARGPRPWRRGHRRGARARRPASRDPRHRGTHRAFRDAGRRDRPRCDRQGRGRRCDRDASRARRRPPRPGLGGRQQRPRHRRTRRRVQRRRHVAARRSPARPPAPAPGRTRHQRHRAGSRWCRTGAASAT